MMIEFFPPNSRALFAHFLYTLPRWVSFYQEYHPQPLFFTQPSDTPLGNKSVHKTPFSWPELEGGQNELLSRQFGPQLGKMFEMWAKHF